MAAPERLARSGFGFHGVRCCIGASRSRTKAEKVFKKTVSRRPLRELGTARTWVCIWCVSACESETLCISVYLFTVFVYLPSRIRIVVNRLDEGREWAQNLISDTLLYGTIQSDAGYPIDHVHWQKILDFAFNDSIERITKDFDDLRLYTQGLRERRILERQRLAQEAQPLVVHAFDQELQPNEYEPDKKPDRPTNDDSDGSYSDDSYHNTHDGYSIPKRASFYNSICSDQNPSTY